MHLFYLYLYPDLFYLYPDLFYLLI